MESLIQYGFTIEEVKKMMDTNPCICTVSNDNIAKLLKLLEEEDCEKKHIRNIFLTNPFYLTRKYDVVKKMIEKLKKLGFTELFLYFDVNPYLLNVSAEDIENYYQNEIKKGLKIEEIKDNLKRNTIF